MPAKQTKQTEQTNVIDVVTNFSDLKSLENARTRVQTSKKSEQSSLDFSNLPAKILIKDIVLKYFNVETIDGKTKITELLPTDAKVQTYLKLETDEQKANSSVKPSFGVMYVDALKLNGKQKFLSENRLFAQELVKEAQIIRNGQNKMLKSKRLSNFDDVILGSNNEILFELKGKSLYTKAIDVFAYKNTAFSNFENNCIFDVSMDDESVLNNVTEYLNKKKEYIFSTQPIE